MSEGNEGSLDGSASQMSSEEGEIQADKISDINSEEEPDLNQVDRVSDINSEEEEDEPNINRVDRVSDINSEEEEEGLDINQVDRVSNINSEEEEPDINQVDRVSDINSEEEELDINQASRVSDINSEEVVDSGSDEGLIESAENSQPFQSLDDEEIVERHPESEDGNEDNFEGTEPEGRNGDSEDVRDSPQPSPDTKKIEYSDPLSPPQTDDAKDPSSSQNDVNDQEKEPVETDSVYDLTDTQVNDPNDSFLDSDANKENEGVNKRKSDEGLEIRDELDFEEEKESAEEGEESDGEKEKKKKEPLNKEEGELSDEDEDESMLRQEPKTVCRFFNKGQCTWGTNCRFLHPGVSDKGNYNMFAAPKPANQTEKEDNKSEKERQREVRRFIPEPVGYESAWERGLRHAKEMMKRANKRKETDADFEEKRFNLSLGQAELDRENDYYTRPASPVYKPTDEVIEYLDPYEKQAIRHFRGGHFENFEVRYKVDPSYPNRGGPDNIRSRRDKFEREVTERIPRRLRPASPVVEEPPKVVKEKRYPRPRVWKEERVQEPPPVTLSKGEAESWADPWARRKTPVKRIKKKKVSRTRSYSSGSSSRSSRSSRSSSYTSYSRSGSRSTSRSRSSRSSSRSITPPIHPRQQRATMNRGARGGRGGNFRGKRMMGPQRNMYQPPQFSQPPNPPPNHPLAPEVSYPRQPIPPMGNRRGMGIRDFKDNRLPIVRKQEPGVVPADPRERIPIQIKQEPRKFQQEPRERITNPIKADPRNLQPDPRERITLNRKPNPGPNMAKVKENPKTERVDMFGRTIRKDIPRSPTPKSQSRSPVRTHGRRKFSLSPSRSRSHSRSGSSSGSSRSRSHSDSRSRSGSGSRSRSRSGSRSRSSSSGSSISPPPSPVTKRKVITAERGRRAVPGTVSYGETAAKSKAIDLVKVAGQKQQIKLTLKKPGPVKQVDKTVIGVEDDSGESDNDARILKKRKLEPAPTNPAPPLAKKPRAPSPTALASLTTATSAPTSKKPSAARREELLKQLRAVEDAIARKRSKPLP